MIIAERKPIKEIFSFLVPGEKVLVLGCGTCVTVCMSGGEKEARELSSLLHLKGWEAEDSTIERQCEPEFNLKAKEEITHADTIISLACGVGVQTLAEYFPEKKIFPGLNTTFMGMPKEQGLWEERCWGCGNCTVHLFGYICPVTRCAKSLLNGPCGGSKSGKCEIKPDRDCAWQLIYDRLKKENKLEVLYAIQPPRDWSTSHYGGQRKMIREDVRL